MLRSLTLILALSLGCSTAAQQPNGPAATLRLLNVDGPPWPVPVTVNFFLLPAPLPLDVTVEGASGSAFTLIMASDAAAPGTGIGGLGFVDLTTAGGFTVVMDGLSLFGGGSLPAAFATIQPSGSTSFGLNAPASAVGHVTGLQALVADPGSLWGMALSAATRLRFVDQDPGPAIYVSPSGNATNPGTANAPLASIQDGINLAATSGLDEVRVAFGTYSEPTVTLQDGVSVAGGWHPVTWERLPTLRSTVQTGPAGMVADGITSPTSIENLEIVAAAGASSSTVTIDPQSSIALTVRGGSSQALGFQRCVFRAGDGGDGANGQDGLDGFFIGTGSPGGDGGISDPGSSPGAGGFGAWDDGEAGAPPLGGSGGTGTFCSAAGNGGPGSTGADGTDGTHGVPGVAGGIILGDAWTIGIGGADGTNGTPGQSGGLGGGGGGSMLLPPCVLPIAGGNGGGGGPGGMRGTRGRGGANGAASFAVYVHGSTPTMDDCTFAAASGGDGGDGGDGGVGFSGVGGGPGGLGFANAGNGGPGGASGRGGDGGHGGGGAGGPSFGLALAGGAAPLLTGSTFINGSGGAGGASLGNPGPSGAAGQTITY